SLESITKKCIKLIIRCWNIFREQHIIFYEITVSIYY
ncbi:hypothetical protein EC991753_1047, partial [Escherichia coli 99.1753]